MYKKYKTLIIICLGIFIGIIGTIIVFLTVNDKDTKNNIKNETKMRSEMKNNKKKEKEEINDSNPENIIDKEKNTIIAEKNNNTQTNNNYGYEVKETNQEKSLADNEVLNYLENVKEEISYKIKDETYKEKARDYFVQIVDFLFYGGTIKNHTFNELTGKAKLEAIKIVIKIEDKIEEYQPGLIDNLGYKYSNIKSKIIDLYTEKTNEYCYNHSDLCNQAREDYDSVKRSFKKAFNVVKDKVSNFYQEKIKKSN